MGWLFAKAVNVVSVGWVKGWKDRWKVANNFADVFLLSACIHSYSCSSRTSSQYVAPGGRLLQLFKLSVSKVGAINVGKLLFLREFRRDFNLWDAR